MEASSSRPGVRRFCGSKCNEAWGGRQLRRFCRRKQTESGEVGW